MNLPEGFQFSQGNLQDFVECRRRFQLRYIREVNWPAVRSEPVEENERFMRQGALFHHLVHQYLSAVPIDRMEKSIEDPDLQRWWGNFLDHAANQIGHQSVRGIFPEITLSAPLGNFRLVAKYDLVVVRSDHLLTILDWKTSRRRPKREWLEERLQTRIYPYLLVQAGVPLNHGEKIDPLQVEMVYWFADFPELPERFVYNTQRFFEDEKYIKELMEQINRFGEDDFAMTDKLERCDYCVYRSLCDRGERAGRMDEILEEEEDIRDIELDFEQIGEIEF